MGNPRRTTAYCLQRCVLSESFGVSLYSRRRARRCANCLLPPPQPSPTGRGSCSAVLPAVVFYIDSRNQRRESMPAIPPFCPLPPWGRVGVGAGIHFPRNSHRRSGLCLHVLLRLKASGGAPCTESCGYRYTYTSSAQVYVANLQFKCNSYKKDIHKRYCKKHQNIAGDRKWMPTVILRPLSGVA